MLLPFVVPPVMSGRLARHGRRAAALAFVAALAGLPATAAAQAPLSIEVAPLRVELKTGPKGTHTQTVTLRNESSAPVHVRARVDDYWLSLDGTPQFKIAVPGEPYSAADWVRLNPSDLTIGPGATAVVRATTTVPADAKDGGYRCGVMFEFDPPGTDAKTARKDMQFRGRVATIIYVTVGNPVPDIDVADLQARPTPDGMPEIVAVLANAGRAYVRTKGSLVISTLDGARVREVPLPSVPVLPESRRELHVSTLGPNDPPLDPGRYKVEIRIDVGMAALLVGETTIEVARVK